MVLTAAQVGLMAKLFQKILSLEIILPLNQLEQQLIPRTLSRKKATAVINSPSASNKCTIFFTVKTTVSYRYSGHLTGIKLRTQYNVTVKVEKKLIFLGCIGGIDSSCFFTGICNSLFIRQQASKILVK